jgi:hypothetical protein
MAETNAKGYWKRYLSKLDTAELCQLEEEVRALKELSGWERVCDLLQRSYMAVFQSLTRGSTRDHADYARQTGYCAGLEEAPELVDAILEIAANRREKEQRAAVADREARQGDQPR